MKGINPALAVGIALPLVLIAILFGVVFIPNLSIKPAYDFIYTDESPYAYGPQYEHSYKVEGGIIKSVPNQFIGSDPKAVVGDSPTLYVYDVQTNEVHQIDLTEAEKLTLDPGPTSPDGYLVSYEYGNGGGFLFYSGGNDSGYFIKKGNAAKRLIGMSGRPYYSDQFNVLGWIIP